MYHCTKNKEIKDNIVMDKLSYALGLSIGRQLSQMGVAELNADDFAQAVKDMIDGKESQIPTNEAQQLLGEYFRQQEEQGSKKRGRKISY